MGADHLMGDPYTKIAAVNDLWQPLPL